MRPFMKLEFELYPAHSKCSIKFYNPSRDLVGSWQVTSSTGSVCLQEVSAYHLQRLSSDFYYFLVMSVKPAGLRRLLSFLRRFLHFKHIRGMLEFLFSCILHSIFSWEFSMRNTIHPEQGWCKNRFSWWSQGWVRVGYPSYQKKLVQGLSP